VGCSYSDCTVKCICSRLLFAMEMSINLWLNSMDHCTFSWFPSICFASQLQRFFQVSSDAKVFLLVTNAGL
jgi:hypothetical protein